MSLPQQTPAWTRAEGLDLVTTSFGNGTFTVPPLDNSLTPEGIFEYSCKHSPDHVWMYWFDKDKEGKVHNLTYKEAGPIIDQAARKLAKFLSFDLDADVRTTVSDIGQPAVRSPPVIAMLANVDSQSFSIYFVACIRAGLVPFPIAINNSAEAIEHLIRASGATALLVAPRGTTPSIDKRIDKALELLTAKGDNIPATMCLPSWEATSAVSSDFEPLPKAKPPKDLDVPVFILHSSGTTAYPKLIRFRAFDLIATLRSHFYIPSAVVGMRQYGGHLPPWHAFGVISFICRPFGAGTTIGLRTPTVPPTPVDPIAVLKEADALGTGLLISPPYLFEEWALDPQCIALLRKRLCTFAGGPLAPDIAKKLIAEGVPLTQSYGSTEAGGPAAFALSFPSTGPHSPDARSVDDRYEAMTYMRFSSQCPVYFRPWGGEKDHFELLLGCTQWYQPCILNDQFEGKAVYATNDVFQRHPTDHTLYKVIGRADNQIMHSTAEKTNPGPLIDILKKHPHIKDVVYFGRQRPHVGALIEPAKGHEMDPKDESALADFRDQIEEAIREANEYAPTHSALFKEMVLVTSPEKPFQRTAKGSIRTGLVLNDYAVEISAAYKNFAELGETSVKSPTKWTYESTLLFVTSVVEESLQQMVQDADSDIFSIGCDSLRAAKIRSILSAAIDQKVHSLPSNFVYVHPTISSLSKAFLALVNDVNDNIALTAPRVDVEAHLTAMESAQLLDLLVQDKRVAKVFAINRPSQKATLEQRQQAALRDRGLSVEILQSNKVFLVEADLSRPDLRINAERYAQLRDESTLIIHNSWTLDFNLTLTSFEDHIRSTRHLLDLALRSSKASPPRILFTSSIATVQGWKMATDADTVPEKPLPNFSSAVGTGYGESKAVAEKLLERASKEAGLTTCSVRIGQLCGSQTKGSWAKSDWLPIIISASSMLRSLPSQGSAPISWLPTDVAAKALLDFGHLEVMPPVLHVVNPNTTSWDSVMGLIADTLSVPLVPFGDWVALLEEAQAQHTVEDLPALRLLDFYRAIAGRKTDTDHGAVEVRLSTDLEVAASETLRSAPKLGAEAVKKWLAYWS